MRNYKNHVQASTESVMWTTSKSNGVSAKLERVKGFKYIRRLSSEEKSLPDTEKRKLQCFVPCNSRATNDFSDRTNLLYLVNRYLPVEIEKYFRRRGCPINEDEFATSELLQWIWRSAIRDGKKINLYIPSSRMRKLLFDWFGISESVYQPSTKKVLETS